MKVRAARVKAAKILANGEDPIQERRDLTEAHANSMLADQRNPTIPTLIEKYYLHQERRQATAEAVGKGKHLAKETLKQYRWTINRHILPEWQDVKVKDVQRVDVRTFIMKPCSPSSAA